MKLIALYLLLITTATAEIQSFKGKITEIIDGDTIIIDDTYKVRFACVDAWESKENKHLQKQIAESGFSKKEILELGRAQRERLAKYLSQRATVYYNESAKFDLYKRIIGVVIVNDVILNDGISYYNNTKLCKAFKLN